MGVFFFFFFQAFLMFYSVSEDFLGPNAEADGRRGTSAGLQLGSVFSGWGGGCVCVWGGWGGFTTTSVFSFLRSTQSRNV